VIAALANDPDFGEILQVDLPSFDPMSISGLRFAEIPPPPSPDSKVEADQHVRKRYRLSRNDGVVAAALTFDDPTRRSPLASSRRFRNATANAVTAHQQLTQKSTMHGLTAFSPASSQTLS
jgi:hypothetical protein